VLAGAPENTLNLNAQLVTLCACNKAGETFCLKKKLQNVHNATLLGADPEGA